jgi:hypothetical protein
MAGLLAYRATGRAGASLAAAGLYGVTAPAFVYATQVYPEMPAALLVATGLWVVLGRRPGTREALALAAVLLGLAWLGTKYGLVGVALGLLALIRLQPGARVLLVGLLAPGALVYAWFHLATYGGLTPYAVNRLYAGSTTVELVGRHFALWDRVYRLAGLWVDREFGLVRWAPVLLLALPALVPLATRRGPVRWAWPLVFGTQFFVAAFLSITMRGWWFPGRMLVPVLPLLAIPLAEALGRAARRPRPVVRAGVLLAAAVLAGYTAAVTAGLVIAAGAGDVALAVDPFALPWPFFSGLAQLFPLYTVYTLDTWLLTAVWVLLGGALVVAPAAGRVRCALGAVCVRWATRMPWRRRRAGGHVAAATPA